MLGSAILVCLSGLMFTSSRFTGATAGYYKVRGVAATRVIMVSCVDCAALTNHSCLSRVFSPSTTALLM